MSSKSEVTSSEDAAQIPPSRYFSGLKRRLERLAQLAGQINNETELKRETQLWLTKNLDELEHSLKEVQKPAESSNNLVSAARAKREFIEKGLKKEHLIILNFLDAYKYATTGQIRKYREIERAIHFLAQLEKVKMVVSYRYQPERGRTSEKCWWLGYAGAKWLSAKEGQTVRYDPRLAKQPPSPNALKLVGMEMELFYQLEIAQVALQTQPDDYKGQWEWDFILPEDFNSTNPKPEDATDQGRLLISLVEQIELQLIEEARKRGEAVVRQELEFKERDYLNLVSFHANHHLFYIPETPIAVVLILCPLDATAKFWAARIEEYSALSARVPVYGVFYDQHHVSACLDQLEDSGIGTIIPEKIAELLGDLVASYPQ